MNKEREVAEKALNFLTHTDAEIVQLERNFKDLEQVHKETKAAIIKTCDGAMELRKAEAETHETTKAAWKSAQDAWQEFKNLELRRKSAERRWEDWRSINAARRQGQTV